jgi:hypothetical protein
MDRTPNALDREVVKEATDLVNAYCRHVSNPSYAGTSKYVLQTIRVQGKDATALTPKNRAFMHQAINQCWVERGFTIPMRAHQ